MLNTETSKDQKLKEVHQQLEQLTSEKQQLQKERAELHKSVEEKGIDIKQLQSKVELLLLLKVLKLAC